MMETSSISSGQEGDSGVESNNSSESMCFIRISIPEFNIQKSLNFHPDDTVWTAKQHILSSIAKNLKEGFNYGLFIPASEGKAGKFLDEERFLKDYSLPTPIGYLEFKIKRRVFMNAITLSRKSKDIGYKITSKYFMDYVKKLDVEKIRKCLKKGFDPNYIDHSNDECPLTMAASLVEASKTIMALFEGGALLDFRSKQGLTALHVAAQNGVIENIKTLLNLGASPNYKNLNLLTPLYLCVCNDTSSRCSEMLLYDHSVVGVVDEYGWTELHQAAKFGRVQHLELLIFYRACLDRQNCSGNTALHICAINNQEECARILMFRGASRSISNFANQTPAEVAYISGNTDLASMIEEFSDSLVVHHREMPTYNSRRRTQYLNQNFPLRTSLSVQYMPYTSDSNFDCLEDEASADMKWDQLHPRMLFMTKTIGQDIMPSLNRDDRSVSTDSEIPNVDNERKHLPRLVILYTNANGYGFVLRGAKAPNKDSSIQLNFTPSKDLPGLQYFENVERGGMAERAGIKAGDFLLEINGIDVSRASHDYTVSLIRRVKTELKLKIVTPSTSAEETDTDGLDTLVPDDFSKNDTERSVDNLDCILIPAPASGTYRRKNGLSTFSKQDFSTVASINSVHGKRLSSCLKEITDSYDSQVNLSNLFNKLDINSESNITSKAKSMFNVSNLDNDLNYKDEVNKNVHKKELVNGSNIANGVKSLKKYKRNSVQISNSLRNSFEENQLELIHTQDNNIKKSLVLSNLHINNSKDNLDINNAKENLDINTRHSLISSSNSSERGPLPALPTVNGHLVNNNNNGKNFNNKNPVSSTDLQMKEDFFTLAEKARMEFLLKNNSELSTLDKNKSHSNDTIEANRKFLVDSDSKIYEEIELKPEIKFRNSRLESNPSKNLNQESEYKILSQLAEEEYIMLNFDCVPPPPPPEFLAQAPLVIDEFVRPPSAFMDGDDQLLNDSMHNNSKNVQKDEGKQKEFNNVVTLFESKSKISINDSKVFSFSNMKKQLEHKLKAFDKDKIKFENLKDKDADAIKNTAPILKDIFRSNNSAFHTQNHSPIKHQNNLIIDSDISPFSGLKNSTAIRIKEGRPPSLIDMTEWSVMDVAAWLQFIGLGEHSDNFIRNNVDGRKLKNFSRPDFIKHGVTNMAQRMTIERAIKKISVSVN